MVIDDAENHTFRAHARPDEGGWWIIEIPELSQPGENGVRAIGGSPDAAGIDQAARELVAVILDVPESSVSVSVEVDPSPEAAPSSN